MPKEQTARTHPKFSTPGGERVYIKGLPAGLTNETCREIFSPYGTVVDTKVLVNDGVSNDGSGQSVAIIRMASEPEAKWLVENLNGNMPEGLTRPIEVSFAGSKYQQSAGTPSSGVRLPAPSGGAPEKGSAGRSPSHRSLRGVSGRCNSPCFAFLVACLCCPSVDGESAT